MHIFALALAFGLCACGKGYNSEQSTDSKKPDKAVAPALQSESETDEAVFRVNARLYPDARSALADVMLKTNPTVIGFGEFHQNTGTRKIRSALERFRQELLPLVAAASSDLIIETWVPKGCGKVEQKVIRDVEKVTERPKETEDETVRLIRASQQQGVSPHILDVKCEQYEALFDTDGEMDYLAMLTLVGTLMGDTAEKALGYRKSNPAGNGRNRVLLYGGAIHNDLQFDDIWKECTFGPRLQQLVPKYIAVDLFVPEFIKNNSLIQTQTWYGLFEKHVSADHVVLIEKAPNSFIIIFKSGIQNG
ncbi:MAG: hypothetical protein JXR76_13860 [Deltaproteobacteria bacterium]|nr:hypothetical protein [Deltaproteobacteria bacterium]